MRMLRREALAGATAALAWPAAPRAQSTPIPLTITAYGLPFVPVTINGQSARALVDTGSVRGVQVSQRLRTAAAIATDQRAGTSQRYDGGGRAVFAGLAERFTLGAYTGTGEAVQHVDGDIERIAGQVGTEFDVILGWPLLSRFDFTIDYSGRTMALEPTGVAAWQLPLIADKALPVVEGEVAGQPMTLLVDTGAPMSNLDVSAASEPLNAAMITRTLALAGRAWPQRFRVRDLTPIRRAYGCLAVIGHSFLADWTFGYRRDGRSVRFG